MKIPHDLTDSGARPRPTLSVFDAAAMIVGVVIGIGIFKTPSIVADNAPTPSTFIALWVIGGAISLIGALCYAELGSSHPNAGGEYHFLSRAYGDWLGFLFAWARMTVIQTGAIAAIAFVFADYAATILPLGKHCSGLYAGMAVIGVTTLNVAGTRRSKQIQNVLTTALTLSLLAMIVGGLAATPAQSPSIPGPIKGGAWSFGFPMIFVLLTYGGWNEAAYLTAEMRDTKRSLVWALLAGIFTITLLYLLLNLSYLNVLGLGGMRSSKAVAADLMRAIWGDAGAYALSLVVMSAALSTLNATIFTGARANYALGRDFAIFSALGRLKGEAATPVNALLVQGAIALVLVLLASFTQDGFQAMAGYTAPAFWLFFTLTATSLFLLRRKAPVARDPFRVPFYPVTPLLFVSVCAYMLYSSFTYAMGLDPGSVGAVIGIIMLFSGIPVLIWARRTPAGEFFIQSRK